MCAQFPGGKPRSCEDMKARYYAIARALLIAREGSEATIANATVVKHPFNAQHERCAVLICNAVSSPTLLSSAATISNIHLPWFAAPGKTGAELPVSPFFTDRRLQSVRAQGAFRHESGGDSLYCRTRQSRTVPSRGCWERAL